MIIGTTVTIRTMTTKESHDKSQIRSMGTDKFVPRFLISDLSLPTYFHYHNHQHHHYHHFYYYYYHYNVMGLSKYIYLQQ